MGRSEQSHAMLPSDVVAGQPAEWVIWFNTERPHDELDDFTPEAVEKLHYDHRRALQEAG